MATNPQRVQSIGDALLNKTATQAQLDHLGRALAYENGTFADYQAATAAGKYDLTIAAIRAHLINPVRAYDAATAAQTASASADAAVIVEFKEG